MNYLIWISIAVMSLISLAIIIDILAEKNVFFTKVAEGEIVVVMHSEKAFKYIGNIESFWVNPKTGKISAKKKTKKQDLVLPRNVLGIYWLGFWPLAKRYEYQFDWNKFAKKKNESGKETSEYELVPRSEPIDSIYFRASYPIRVIGAETSENVPLTLDLLITTQTINADTALFKVKSPGWLAALTGAVTGVVRDFVGKDEVNKLMMMQTEVNVDNDGTSIKGKTLLQKAVDQLNLSVSGNPSIVKQFGQKIISVNLLSIEIDRPKNDIHGAAIEKYTATRKGEALVETAKAGKKVALEEAKKIGTLAKAEAGRITLEGEATAGAARKLTDAVKENPHWGAISIANAIEKQKTATTLILGEGVLPTKGI